MKKKYEFTGRTIEVDGKTLHEIRALRDFGDVKKGDLGGHIEFEKNLSHYYCCWVYPGGLVSGEAKIAGDALVMPGAKVHGWVHVYGHAVVPAGADIGGFARISNNL